MQARTAAQRTAKVLALGLTTFALRQRAGSLRRTKVFALGLWPQLLKDYGRLMSVATTMKFMHKRRRPSKTSVHTKIVAGKWRKASAKALKASRASKGKSSKGSSSGPKLKPVHWDVYVAAGVAVLCWGQLLTS